MLIPTLFLLGLGFVAAIGLSIASKVFYVYEDPKIGEVEDSLLGANCGGCGYAGCSAAAQAVVAGKEGPDICVAGGPDISLAVASVMGMEVEIKEAEVASLSCTYGFNDADKKYIYNGINDCRAANLFGGGQKVCTIGCVGLGTCVRACPFGALVLSDNGLPVIDIERCRGCGVCVDVCPKHIIKLSSTTLRMIGDYRDDECTTPCQRLCPTGIDIPSYIKMIKEKNFKGAIRKIREKNPLPLICSRICPAPCESECRRGLVDQSLAINDLKRFVADYEIKCGERFHPYKGPDSGKKVAVIGGGAQGLTSSYYLASLGHQPTIYEATPKLGGIIRNVISKSRLPDEIINQEIQGILDIGVKAETSKAIGSDINITSLLNDNDFDSVVLASGGFDSRKILRKGLQSEVLIPGLYILLDFFADNSKDKELKVGKNVYIVGGGTSTLSAAQICLSRGAEKVTLIYPFTEDEIKSRGIDIENVNNDNIQFIFSSKIVKLSGEGDTLQQISIKHLDNSIELLSLETLIVATGRLSDLVFVKIIDEETGDRTKKWQTIDTYKVLPENKSSDLFNIRDNALVNDNIAVVKSISRGRKIARSLHLYLNGKDIVPQENIINNESKILNTDIVEDIETIFRLPVPHSSKSQNYGESDSFYRKDEIVIGYSEEIAVKESERCLQCGLICYTNCEQ